VAVEHPLQPFEARVESALRAGRATTTTVASRYAMPEPSTVAKSNHRASSVPATESCSPTRVESRALDRE
jgi:hypothetical protein